MKKVKKISIVSFSVVFLVAFIMAICIILLLRLVFMDTFI